MPHPGQGEPVDHADAGRLTIALLAACGHDGTGITSDTVQALLDEACAEPQLARSVLAMMLASSTASLRAFVDATQRDRAQILQDLALNWERLAASLE